MRFPSFERAYTSAELFPLFQNRIPNPKRGDYVGIRQPTWPDGEGGRSFRNSRHQRRRAADRESGSVPKIQKRRDGTFSVRFFLHGWRHVNMDSQNRLSRLKEGDPLQVTVEVNNPVTGAAVQLETADDYHMIGWAPRLSDQRHAQRARAMPWGYSCARMQAESASRSLQPKGPGRVGGPSARGRGTDVGT